MNNLRGNLKGLSMGYNELPRVNKITLLIKSQANPQRSREELYSEALDIFINRIVRGVYA